jgi:hypothetical protein
MLAVGLGVIFWGDLAYQLDVGAHLCNLAHLDHDELIDLGVFLFVVAHDGAERE